MCAGDGGVTYLLGDMDLLSLEEESADSTYTLDEWQKMAYRDPAGTIGMKPPEVGIIWHSICDQVCKNQPCQHTKVATFFQLCHDITHILLKVCNI